MKRILCYVLSAILMTGLLTGFTSKETNRIFNYRFADAKECTELLLSNEDYYSNLTKTDLEYRMQKKNATLEELLDFTKTQTRAFSKKEKKAIDTTMDIIEKTCIENGYHLPRIDNIVFCKTTMAEECNAGAYTHGTEIYLGELSLMLSSFMDPKENYSFIQLVAHELFHCLTRNDSEFRKAMYEILGFTVTGKDYDFPQSTKDKIYSNPDVGHHDSYAAFEINGEKKDCVVIVSVDKPFKNRGDNFFDHMYTGLVPVDQLDVIYKSNEASNFWDIFGKNTNYVIDPEETMADNFSFTIVYGLKGKKYPSPKIIKAIDAYLKQ